MSIFEQIAASGFKTVDLIIVLAYLAILIFLGLSLEEAKRASRKVPMTISSPATLLLGGL